ncbi:MAG TPA: hypothetical protein VIJ57_11285 [Hanamia sp.]
MKKFLTIILAAAGTISFASAQPVNGKNVTYNDHKKMIKDYDQHNIYGKTNNVNYNDAKYLYQKKQAKMAAINRDYDQKIAFVKYNRRLSNREKSKQIQLIQNQRNNELKKMDFQYAAAGHQSNDRNAKYDRNKW